MNSLGAFFSRSKQLRKQFFTMIYSTVMYINIFFINTYTHTQTPQNKAYLDIKQFLKHRPIHVNYTTE